MKYTRNYDGRVGLLSLFYGPSLLAFAIGNQVYYKVASDFYHLEGSDLNEVFSNIICNTVNLDKNNLDKIEKYVKDIPVHPQGDKTQTIPVLVKQIKR